MSKFIVSCTKIYNGTLTVNARTAEEAMQYGQDILCKNEDAPDWVFGEATADFAELTEDEPTESEYNDLGIDIRTGTPWGQPDMDYEH